MARRSNRTAVGLAVIVVVAVALGLHLAADDVLQALRALHGR